MTEACLEHVLCKLRDCRGVKALKVLTIDEKRRILEVEEKEEEKIAYGMCRTLNQGVREALQRDCTVATTMDTSVFEYPHHPHMVMVCGDIIVGEQVRDLKRIEELKRNRSNFFLWDNFVIYMPKLPKGQEDRQRLRMVYAPRTPPQLEDIVCAEKGVIGIPSTEGDVLVKKLLSSASNDATTGTCLIGFNIKH